MSRLKALILLAATTAAALVVTLAPGDARADDRKLFVGFREVPYVFILLDNSASMNWSSVCTQEWFDQGLCGPMVCPDGGCMPDLAGDDPSSKLYQAKEVLYQVLLEVDDVDFGFATYNQDDMFVRSKHWMYRSANAGPELEGTGVFYPAADSKDVFGRTWDCFSGDSAINEIGCEGRNAADLGVDYEARRVQRLPKGGEAFTQDVTFYVTPDVVGAPGDFKVTYGAPHDGSGGAVLPGAANVWVDVTTCKTATNSNDCDPAASLLTETVQFRMTNEFLFMDVEEDFGDSNGTRGENNGDLENFFGLTESTDFPMLEGEDNSCGGLDMNDDSSLDAFFEDPSPGDGDATYNLRWPTVVSPAPDDFGRLDNGDFIPWDWTDEHKIQVLNRLAPNRLLGEAIPDFTVSRYFEDVEDASLVGEGASEPAHRLKNEQVRPILASTASPLKDAIDDFREWYDGCRNPNCATDDEGFDVYASARDPNWPCRKKYLLILSDGDESCGGGNEPCSATANMQAQLDVDTLVIGWGVDPENDADGGADILTCLPANSSNIPALFPANKAELLESLTTFFDAITGRTATFSAAAVPSVQAESADKLYLSSLSPVADQAIWPSRLDAFLKPLPLTDENIPDIGQTCPDPSDEASACHLWNAAEVVRDTQVTPGDPVGFGFNQRRALYSEFPENDGIPRTRRLFQAVDAGDVPLATEYDFWRGLGISFVPGLSDPDAMPPIVGSEEAAREAANDIVATTMAVKTGTLPDDSEIDYVLGDVFHSDPTFINSPGNNLYFIRDIASDGTACADGNPGYRCFFFKHQKRRKMLAAGHNDGMFHFYEAGVWNTSGDFEDGFDNGTGREIFAYMPRPTLPVVREVTEMAQHRFSVDGRGTAADVFIDPVHDGTPTPGDRVWRTVMMGGLRRGGWALEAGVSDLEGPPGSEVQKASGYFLLDITQPDPVDETGDGDGDGFPDFIPDTADPPTCIDVNAGYTEAECGPVPFATAYWEFTDSVLGLRAGDGETVGVRLDEDGNGGIDLAPTWSTVNIGRMRVCSDLDSSGTADCDPFADDNEVEERYVAIFGGGLDNQAAYYHNRGNFLYIVDLETGKPIYKQPLLGAAPSEPAAVDTDFDGFLDTVYIGTTLGIVYRADLEQRIGGTTLVPELTPQTVTGQMSDGALVEEEQPRIQNALFAPYPLFHANDGTIEEFLTNFALGTAEPRQFFFRPSVVFLPDLDLYALAVGTGNREDLFDRGEPTGRFYVFVDDVGNDELVDGSRILSTSDLTPIAIDGLPFDDDTNLLQVGDEQGWWMELTNNQRLVAEPFALSGVLFFSTFIPADQAIVLDDSLCREAGTSQIFGTLITNGDGLLFTDADSDATRYVQVQDLVSSPFTEQSQTKNPPPDDTTDFELSVNMQRVQERLKQLFPDRCRFPPGYRIDVKTRTTDTGIVFVAPVPICVIEKNYKDF